MPLVLIFLLLNLSLAAQHPLPVLPDTSGLGRFTSRTMHLLNFSTPEQRNRVIIRKGDAEDGGDWHLNRSFRVLKTLVKRGDSVLWKTFSISSDFFRYPVINGESGYPDVILFQGVPNSGHTLAITGDKELLSMVRKVLVYHPYLTGTDDMPLLK